MDEMDLLNESFRILTVCNDSMLAMHNASMTALPYPRHDFLETSKSVSCDGSLSWFGNKWLETRTRCITMQGENSSQWFRLSLLVIFDEITTNILVYNFHSSYSLLFFYFSILFFSLSFPFSLLEIFFHIPHSDISEFKLPKKFRGSFQSPKQKQP